MVDLVGLVVGQEQLVVLHKLAVLELRAKVLLGATQLQPTQITDRVEAAEQEE
jgi:hypothetical protein